MPNDPWLLASTPSARDIHQHVGDVHQHIDNRVITTNTHNAGLSVEDVAQVAALIGQQLAPVLRRQAERIADLERQVLELTAGSRTVALDARSEPAAIGQASDSDESAALLSHAPHELAPPSVGNQPDQPPRLSSSSRPCPSGGPSLLEELRDG